MPKLATLSRAISNARSAVRPPNPADDPDSTIDAAYFMPEFYREEVKGEGGSRHLIFGGVKELRYLAWCKRWYIDATFKIVSRPFTQLLTVNGFLKSASGLFFSLSLISI